MPHGTILGPMLFMLYIDDIDNAIASLIKLLVEISVLYSNIRNQNNQVILQNDLDTISSWAEKWLMELNINKRFFHSIILKRYYSFHDYDIHGAAQNRVANHDYPCIAI